MRDRHEGNEVYQVTRTSGQMRLTVARESPTVQPKSHEESDMLVKPEEVGLSSGRLGRISDHLRRYVDAGKLAGTLTLVARRGKIAYFEPLGHLEVERKRPVAPDSIFRIYSMTKPIASAGLMMLWEQGRFQLDDPVHKFIPSWRDQRVFVGGNHPRGRRRRSSGP